jgi:hypothetical protein
MYKVLGGDRKEYGPVSAEEVRRWITEGRLNGRSLIQGTEPVTDWQPLSVFPEFAAAIGAQPSVTPPVLGATSAINAEALTTEILARQPLIRVGECLSLSWRLVMNNTALLLGACAVVWGIGMVQFIPVVGFAYRIAAGALFGGLYLIFLKRIRGEAAEVGEVFAGFQVALGQLILAGFVSYALSFVGVFCCILPGIYLAVAWIFCVPLVADKRLEFWSAMELSRRVVTRVWFEVLALLLIAFLPTILAGVWVGTKASFSLLSAMQHVTISGPQDIAKLLSAILKMNADTFAASFLNRLVLLLNLPFALGALMYAYEDLFGSRTRTGA